jgi:dipeptidyl aminopeptidase/acylaminoacyl peptidase
LNRESIPLAELVSLPNFYFVTPSWDKKHIAFYWDKTGQMELYLLDLPDGAPYQLSHGEVPRSLRAGFIWSRDGKKIVFAKDQNGNEQHDLYSFDINAQIATQLTNTPKAQEIPVEFSPDDEWVSMFSNRDGQMNLYKMRPDGAQVTQLKHFSNPVTSGGIWSPDGQWLAFGVNETSELKNQDIYIIHLDGSGLRRVLQVKIGSIDTPVKWFPDSCHLAITSDASGVERPGILSVDTGQVRWLGKNGVEESTSGLSEDGNLLVAIRNQDAIVRPVIYQVDTGNERTLKLEPGFAVGSEFVLSDTHLLLSHMSATTRNQLLLYDINSGKQTVIIEAEYGSIDPDLFVDPAYINYKSSDGLTIAGILYTPNGIADNERLPAIVSVHGGPTGQFFRSFDPYAQFLANQGFVVLEPNIRGSTGYGVEFRDMNRYDWGGMDLEDVAAAAGYLKGLSFVDPDRIAVFGGSYGGYMTLMQVVKKPQLWKAAVSWVGISDLHKLYEHSMEHFKYFLRSQMGDPKENEDLWRQRSAITHVKNTKAKLLLIHGVNDPRCPIEQSRLFRDALIDLGYAEGQDFEYVELTEEGHGSSDIKHKIRTYNLMADFLKRRL